MKESVLSVKEKQQHTTSFPSFKVPASTNIFEAWPVKSNFWRFRYIITRLYDWVQLALYSTRYATLWLWSTDEYVFVLFWARVYL